MIHLYNKMRITSC